MRLIPNDLKLSKEQLEKVYQGIMEEVNDLQLQIESKKPFLALIVKAKASIIILPKFQPKRVMVVVPLLNSSIPILVLRCLDLDF